MSSGLPMLFNSTGHIHHRQYQQQKQKMEDKGIQTERNRKFRWSGKILRSFRKRKTSQERLSVTSMDLTTLGEAHGMIVDLLADPSIPHNVSGALRIISDMLSPLLQQSFNRNSFSSPLVTVLEKTQTHMDEASVKDQPDLKDDTPYSLKNRLSRQLGGGTRRMSSSYTTTTSATGMPSLDIEYRRHSSASVIQQTQQQQQQQQQQQEDRNSSSRTPSPSPKPNRAKSYAGLQYYPPEIRREFVKSRSLCQASPPVVRRNSLLKEQLEGEDGESIFKTELSCSESNFIDDNLDTDIGDEETFENEEPLENEPKMPSNNDNQDDSDAEKREGDSDCPSSMLDVDYQPGNKSRSSSASDTNNCLVTVTSAAAKSENRRSPVTTRKVDNLSVAPATPVRKNSRDESAMKRASRDNSRRGSNASPCAFQSSEIQLEVLTANSNECKNDLDKLLDWGFPIFDLSEKCHILTQVAFRIFQNRGFFQKFKIPQDTFFRYFRTLENGYHDIPYHNQIHAADVLQGTYYFTNHKIPGFSTPLDCTSLDCNSRRGSLDNDKVFRLPETNDNEDIYGSLSDVFPDLELMALYTAAAMHDFDHPGRTNAFLVATLNPKALLYNDRSVLENHHAAAAWALLLSDPAVNFLSSLDSFDFKRFRFIVVEEILSTDLKKHFEFLSEWNAKISEQGGGLNWSSESDRLLVGQMCIKLSDISGPTKSWDLHYRWTQRIVEEFYMQGDAEDSQGMPISPYMDRNQPRLPQLQDSFIKHLVGPLYNAYSRAGLVPGEWVDTDEDLDDENDEEDGDVSSQSYVNDSTSERSEDESDVRVMNGGNDKGIEVKRRKRIFCEITDNFQNNMERWQQIINADAIAKGKEDALDDAGNSGNKADIAGDQKLDGNRHATIDEEEEESDSTPGSGTHRG
eukprot:gene12831-14148_t